MKKLQITMHKSNNQLLYFTSTSIIGNNKGIVFISDRTGNANLFYKDFEQDEENQLTFNTEGILKSYVYFNGTPNRGFGKASVSLNSNTGNIYYIQGRDIMEVNINGKSRKLATLPEDQVTAFTHVSADCKRLCVPTTDTRALEFNPGDKKPDYDIDRRVQDENLTSYLRVFDIQTGEQIACEAVKKAWITHVQFSPVNNNHILYNHEWACVDVGIRRLWLWNGKEHIRLRLVDNNRSNKDWTCHEMWEKDGKTVIYHGDYEKGQNYIGRVSIDDLKYVEIPLGSTYKSYGHFTVGDTGVLVSDGYYIHPDNKPSHCGQWISLQKVDWENKTIEWIPLCEHESNWDSQCSHPHPIFGQNDQYVYFTSNKTGQRQIYRIQTNL